MIGFKWILFAVFCAAMVIDCLQTKVFLKENRELNNLIVWFSRKLDVEWYFGFWIAVTAIAVYYLPHDYGLALIAFLSGMETHCIWRNHKVGVKIG